MRRAAVLALLAVVGLAVAATALAAARDDRDLAFTPSVRELRVVTDVFPRQELCQARKTRAVEGFAGVRFLVGSYGRPSGPVAVTLRDPATRRAIATGQVPAGQHEGVRLSVPLRPAVPQGTRFNLCFENRGATRFALFGNVQSRASRAARRRRVELPRKAAITVDYLRAEPKSALAQVPEMFRRASLFRPDGVGAWTFWALLALLVLAVPALLARALADALKR
jgi:hypothetical protein